MKLLKKKRRSNNVATYSQCACIRAVCGPGWPSTQLSENNA